MVYSFIKLYIDKKLKKIHNINIQIFNYITIMHTFSEMSSRFNKFNKLKNNNIIKCINDDHIYEIKKIEIQKNGHMLKYISDQTTEICKLAVQQNGLSLQHINCYKFVFEIKNYIEICKIAVEQNGFALKYVNSKLFVLMCISNIYDDICKIAIQQNPEALKLVKYQTYELCKLALQQNGLMLRYVENQTKELCLLAIQQNKNAYKYIRIDLLEFLRFEENY